MRQVPAWHWRRPGVSSLSLLTILNSELNPKGYSSRAMMQHQNSSLNIWHASSFPPAKKNNNKKSVSNFFSLFYFPGLSPENDSGLAAEENFLAFQSVGVRGGDRLFKISDLQNRQGLKTAAGEVPWNLGAQTGIWYSGAESGLHTRLLDGPSRPGSEYSSMRSSSGFGPGPISGPVFEFPGMASPGDNWGGTGFSGCWKGQKFWSPRLLNRVNDRWDLPCREFRSEYPAPSAQLPMSLPAKRSDSWFVCCDSGSLPLSDFQPDAVGRLPEISVGKSSGRKVAVDARVSPGAPELTKVKSFAAV